MQTQTVEFAIIHTKGEIARIGRSSILQPKTSFKGGTVKCKDKPRQKDK